MVPYLSHFKGIDCNRGNFEASHQNEEANEKHDLPSNFYLGLAPSPINVNNLKAYLKSYNQNEAKILLDGFIHGFSLHYQGPRAKRLSRNLKSAIDNPTLVQSKLNKEICEGRMAGPFTSPPFLNLIVSPVGLVPKKALGEFRLIHHLSYPEGESINDGISKEFSTVQYTSFDAEVNMIQSLGRNCKIFKMDIKNAFRLLPINPNDFELLGISLNEKLYIDKALPFGAAASCKTFECFSTF